MDEPLDPRTLEREVQRAVDALPSPQAPQTLLPRLMADIRRRHASGAAAVPTPAWQVVVPAAARWSPLAQATLVAVTLAVLSALYWMWPVLGYATAVLPEPVQQVGRRADVLAASATDLLQVGALVWHAVVGPIVKALFMLTVVLATACALCVAALGRIALGGAHQS